jgi:hypothetical protein
MWTHSDSPLAAGALEMERDIVEESL